MKLSLPCVNTFRLRFLKPQEKIIENEKEKLVSDLHEVTENLQSAYNRFENAYDDDLIEASIFEIEALKARYRYLIKSVKAAK